MSTYTPRTLHSTDDSDYPFRLSEAPREVILQEFGRMVGFRGLVAGGPVTDSLPGLFIAVARANQHACDLAKAAHDAYRWKFKLIVWRKCWCLRVSMVRNKRRGRRAWVYRSDWPPGGWAECLKTAFAQLEIATDSVGPFFPVGRVDLAASQDAAYPRQPTPTERQGGYYTLSDRFRTTFEVVRFDDQPRRGGKAARKMARRRARGR